VDQDATLTFPNVFRDGRARKLWVNYGPPSYDQDGPFDSDGEAQDAIELRERQESQGEQA